MNDAGAPKLEPTIPPASIVTPDPDPEQIPASGLPADHPEWQRDAVLISARVRALLASLRPVVVRVLGFWDHVVRSVGLGGGRRLEIDPSGCYRLR